MHRHISYIFPTLAVTLLLLAACSSSEPAPREAEEEVAIGMRLSTQAMTETRAGKTGPMADEQLKLSGAGVFAYYTGTATWSTVGTSTPSNFMYNQQVEYDDYEDVWEYEPMKYWPNDNATADDEGATGSAAHSYLSFFAYAPWVDLTQNANPALDAVPTDDVSKAAADRRGIISITGNAATGHPYITYRLHETAAEQVDLLWGTRGKASYQQVDGTANVVDLATTPLNTDLIKQTTTERVDFLFKHALSSIDIYVQRIYDEVLSTGKTPADEDEVAHIYISELKLNVAAGGMYTEGVLDLATGLWSGTPNPSAFSILIDRTRIRPFLAGTTLDNSHITEVRNLELDGFNTNSGVNGTLTRLTNETYATMLIPVKGNTGIIVTPHITYSFVTQDDAMELGLTNTANTHRYSRILHSDLTGTNVTIGTEVSPSTFQLERGKRYILVCYIGVESVQYRVLSVEDWDFPLRFTTATVPDFANPYNETDGTNGTPKTLNED